MRLALNALFVLWCLVLVVVAFVASVVMDGCKGEANGGYLIGKAALFAAVAILAVSIALRVLL